MKKLDPGRQLMFLALCVFFAGFMLCLTYDRMNLMPIVFLVFVVLLVWGGILWDKELKRRKATRYQRKQTKKTGFSNHSNKRETFPQKWIAAPSRSIKATKAFEPESLENSPATPVFYVGKTVRPARKKLETFDLVGESYSFMNFVEIGRINSDWNLSRKELLARYNVDDFIFMLQFDNLPVQIIRERDNHVDKNALRVDISGMKAGYIARKDQNRIAPLLRRNDLLWRADVSWGPHKKIYEGDDGKVHIHTQTDFDLSVTLSVFAQ